MTFANFSFPFSYYETFGVFNPEEWAKNNKNRKNFNLRLESRKFLQKLLTGSRIPDPIDPNIDYPNIITNKIPFIMTVMDPVEKLKAAGVIPVLEFDDKYVRAFDGKIYCLKHDWIALAPFGALDPVETRVGGPFFDLAEKAGFRHGFDYSHLTETGIYGIRFNRSGRNSNLEKEREEKFKNLTRDIPNLQSSNSEGVFDFWI